MFCNICKRYIFPDSVFQYNQRKKWQGVFPRLLGME